MFMRKSKMSWRRNQVMKMRQLITLKENKRGGGVVKVICHQGREQKGLLWL